MVSVRSFKQFLFFALLLLVASQATAAFKLTSSSIESGHKMDAQFTCDGKNVSPALAWSDVPSGTKSFVLIMDDPDAPHHAWVHWLIYNIPATITGIPEAVAPEWISRNGIQEGVNSFGRTGYGGPCPPKGTHRYFFKLYALDSMLSFPKPPTKKEIIRAQQEHVLKSTRFIALFKRKIN